MIFTYLYMVCKENKIEIEKSVTVAVRSLKVLNIKNQYPDIPNNN